MASRSQSGLCSKPDCLASRRMSSWVVAKKKKKPKQESHRATLASISKEMAQPRFAESARKKKRRTIT